MYHTPSRYVCIKRYANLKLHYQPTSNQNSQVRKNRGYTPKNKFTKYFLQPENQQDTPFMMYTHSLSIHKCIRTPTKTQIHIYICKQIKIETNFWCFTWHWRTKMSHKCKLNMYKQVINELMTPRPKNRHWVAHSRGFLSDNMTKRGAEIHPSAWS
jgi:hypothetical protein